MSEKIDWKIWWTELRGRVKSFYPYYLGFYLLSIIVAIFSATWRTFFYWPAFHGSIIFFTLLYLLSFSADLAVRHSWRQIALTAARHIILLAKAARPHLAYFIRRQGTRLSLLIIILAFALFKGIGVIDFLVLAYALISIIFIWDSRYAAGAALVLLAACPVFLMSKKDTWAEITAIYAYYFLVITVLTQIRELMREKKAANQSLQK
ncbi:MAG: hypothetical protein WC456_01325 [Patescibacteria group bacterium]